MGCSSSVPDDPSLVGTESEKSINRDLEREIKAQYETEKMMVKVLILGSGESGKSTILKQMKILLAQGYQQQSQREEFRDLVRENSVECMKALCKAVTDLGINWTSPEAKQKGQRVIECASEGKGIPLDIRHDIELLWKDDRIQSAYLRANEFHLLDSASYFFQNLDRIFSPDYVPTVQDVLRARRATTGVVETDFEYETLPFKIYDVGGQRGERRKWIHCFEGVRAIMYVASLSEYDQVLVEDSTRNRMAESLNVFEAIINLPWFRKTPIILFLNKNDLFQEKAKKIDLGIYHSTYNGGLNPESALMWIREQYFSKNQDPNKTIYCHLTDATDTNCIAFVWKATKHIILEQHLSASGLILY